MKNKKVIAKLLDTNSIIVGLAGTGKTVILKSTLKYLHEHNIRAFVYDRHNELALSTHKNIKIIENLKHINNTIITHFNNSNTSDNIFDYVIMTEGHSLLENRDEFLQFMELAKEHGMKVIMETQTLGFLNDYEHLDALFPCKVLFTNREYEECGELPAYQFLLKEGSKTKSFSI